MKNINTARPYADLKTPFTVDKNGAFAEYIVQEPDLMPDIALGATVIIKDFNNGDELWIAGQIIGLRAISPFSPERENLLYIEPEVEDPTELLEQTTGPHTHQPMIIRVSLEREMVLKNKEKRKFSSFPVQRPPSARSRLYFPNIVPNRDESPSLQEILDIRANGLSLGMVGFGNTPYESGGKFLNYNWDIDKLDNKHIFVVGESGSGKTVFLKNLAYELRKDNQNNRVILTDVQGDIIQLLLPEVAEILKPTGWQEKVNIESAKKTNEKFKSFQLIIPARPEGTSPNLLALKKLAKNNGVIVREIGLRLQDLSTPSDVEYLFRTSSEQVAMLLDDEAEFLKEHPSLAAPASISNLKRTIDRLVENSNGQSQIRSHSGTSYYQSTYSAALRALRSLGQYFDYHQESLNSSVMPLNYFDFDGTTILYLDELDQDERIMWEMQLVKWLYENKKKNWKAYVFFDEAHQIIPAKPIGIGAIGTFDRLRVNFEKLAREGRKFDINLILSTQNPKDLHPIVPEQCPTRIVMKINPRNAKYAFLDDNLAMIANRFSHGQFWIQSPFNGTVDWVRVHSIAPAIPHQPMTDFWSKAIDKASQIN